MTVKPLPQLRIDVAEALNDNTNWEITPADSRNSVIDTIDSLEDIVMLHATVDDLALAANIWTSVPQPAGMKKIYQMTALDSTGSSQVAVERRYSGDFLSIRSSVATVVDLLVSGPAGTATGGTPVSGSITDVQLVPALNAIGVDVTASTGIAAGLVVEFREVGTTQWWRAPRAVETPKSGRYCSICFNQPSHTTLIKHNTQYEVYVAIENGTNPDQQFIGNVTTLLDRVLIPQPFSRRVECADTAALNAALVDLQPNDKIVLTGPGPYQPNKDSAYRIDQDGVTIEGEYLTDVELTVESIAANTLTVTAHGFSDNDVVFFTTTGALPTGIDNPYRIFYVTAATADTFQLTDEFGAAALPVSGGTGTLTVHKHRKPVLSGAYYPTFEGYLTDIWRSTLLSEMWERIDLCYVDGVQYKHKQGQSASLQPGEYDVSGSGSLARLYINVGVGENPSTKIVTASGDPNENYTGEYAFRQQNGGLNCTFKNLTFEHYFGGDALGGQGGGLLLRLGDVTITDCVFRFNSLAVRHLVETPTSNRRLLIDNCVFQAESKIADWNEMKTDGPNGHNGEFQNGIVSAGSSTNQNGQITVRNCKHADGRSCVYIVNTTEDDNNDMQMVHYDANIYVRTIDNCIEMDGWCCGHLLTNNEMYDALEPVSIQPMRHGPVFGVGNKVQAGWQTPVDPEEWTYASGIKHAAGLIGVFSWVNNTLVAAPYNNVNACPFYQQNRVDLPEDVTHHDLLMSNNIIASQTGNQGGHWPVYIGLNNDPGRQRWNDNIYWEASPNVSGVAKYGKDPADQNLTWDEFKTRWPPSITSTDTTAANEADPLLITIQGGSQRWNVFQGSPAIGSGVPVEGFNDRVQNLSKGWQLDAS